ncbi:unnamed protein product [Parnassius apollo]|uniref:(apollo) hypothetical protein n=1 Tax=Parnassius apollo TaxID=110799 RepID=A0A8S3XRC5_PARAO|nr:unnamed protein product [Parnassius apollo]
MQPGAVERGVTYQSVIAEAKAKIKLSDLGLQSVTLRQAATGARLFEVAGTVSDNAPTCKSEQPINIRAAIGEVVEIECIVDANPKVSLTYQWWFNRTIHARRELKMSPSHVQNEANTNEKAKTPQEESSNMLLTGEKKSDSANSLDKNPDIIPLNTKLSDTCSNKSSNTDNSSVRPLISTTNVDELEIPNRFNAHYNHTMNSTSQYEYPLRYRIPNIQPSLAPMPNIGTNVHRQPFHNVYEDWLRYKNTLPLDSSHLLSN